MCGALNNIEYTESEKKMGRFAGSVLYCQYGISAISVVSLIIDMNYLKNVV